MTVALPLYGLAAVFDVRTRRIPNWVWGIGLLACLVRGVTAVSVVEGVGLFAVGWIAWYFGEMGGADVKALGLLPLAIPASWPVAFGAGYLITAAGFVALDREEIPFLVPIFAGVVVAVITVPYL